MSSLRSRIAAAALTLAAPLAAHAQLSENFDASGAVPATWTRGFGAAASVVQSVGLVTPPSAANFALLTANDNANNNPENFLTNGTDWNYAFGDAASLPPSTGTGSVLLSPIFGVTRPATLSFALNFLANPFQLVATDAFGVDVPQNRDWFMVQLRRLGGTPSVTRLLFGRVQGDGTVALTDAAGTTTTLPQIDNVPVVGPINVAAVEPSFAASYGWRTTSQDLTAAGEYQLEFTVANEGDGVTNKQYDAALAIDDVAVTPTSAVPEPGTWMLLATGLAGTVLVARRKRGTR